MRAFITLPFQEAPVKLQKISQVIYYDSKHQKFYKSSVLDPITAFVKNDLVSRQNITLTPFNPAFLVLEHFDRNPQISISSIPKYLSLDLYKQFGEYQQGSSSIKMKNSKVLDFLQKKAIELTQFVDQKGYYKQELIKLSKTNTAESQHQKQIPAIIINILKQDVPEQFMNELVQTRIKQQSIKKAVFMDNYQEPITKQPIKKKSASKPKPPPVIPDNQKTLFGFMNKSGSKK